MGRETQGRGRQTVTITVSSKTNTSPIITITNFVMVSVFFFSRGFIKKKLFNISPKYIMKYLNSQICVSKSILHLYR